MPEPQANGQPGRESAAVPTGTNLSWTAEGTAETPGQGQEVAQTDDQIQQDQIDPNQVPQEEQVEGEVTEPVEGEISEQEGDVQAPTVEQLSADIQERDSRIQNLESMLNFFQNQLNENLNTPIESAQQQPQQEQLPPGIKAPETWETQTEQAKYYEHQAAQIYQKQSRKDFNELVTPMLDRQTKAITSIMEHLAKTIYPDYETVVPAAWRDAWVFDETGSKIVGEKNPALIRFFKESPFPHLAMYQYALNKQAPQNIKKGVQKNTQKVISKLNQRPVGPTQFKGSGVKTVAPKLDWNTPKDQVDKMLGEMGVIPK